MNAPWFGGGEQGHKYFREAELMYEQSSLKLKKKCLEHHVFLAPYYLEGLLGLYVYWQLSAA